MDFQEFDKMADELLETDDKATAQSEIIKKLNILIYIASDIRQLLAMAEMTKEGNLKEILNNTTGNDIYK